MTWQPIETAPKDGAPILLYVGPDEQYVGEWSAIVGAFYHGETDRIAPTHWQPLPEPPGSEHMKPDEFRALIRDQVAKASNEAGSARPQACGSCRFWSGEAKPLAMTRGDCTKHAPVAHVNTNGAPVRLFPVTASEESCGAWDRRAEIPLEPIDICPETGGEHAWIDIATNDSDGRKCLKCGREG